MIKIGRKIVAGSADVDLSAVLTTMSTTNGKLWIGTQTQYEALPASTKADNSITFVVYDSDEDVYLIADSLISYAKTWSSSKISTELAKKINATNVYTKTDVDRHIAAAVSSALKYKGVVATVADLSNIVNPANGDSYLVRASGYLYAYNEDNSDWDELGTATDMTNYYTKSEVDTILADFNTKFQYSTMPAASADFTYPIQYIGAEGGSYKFGRFYKAVSDGATPATYSWTECKADEDIVEISGTIELNDIIRTGLYVARNGAITTVNNAPSDISSAYLQAGFGLEVFSYGSAETSNDAFVTQILTVYPSGDLYYRSRSWGSSAFIWNSWKKVATTGDTEYFYQTSGVAGEYDANNFAVIGKITRYCVYAPVHGYQVDGVAWWGFYETARFRDGEYGYQTFRTMLGSPVMAIRQYYGGNWSDWKQLATTDSLTQISVSDYQFSTVIDDTWFDLGTSLTFSSYQAFVFYEITCGRVDAFQTRLIISCSGDMSSTNYIKAFVLTDGNTGANLKLKVDSNHHLWLKMTSYCYAHVKIFGRFTGLGSSTTTEPTGVEIPVYTILNQSSMTSSVTSGSTAPITSGGVYDAMGTKMFMGEGSVTVAPNRSYMVRVSNEGVSSGSWALYVITLDRDNGNLVNSSLGTVVTGTHSFIPTITVSNSVITATTANPNIPSRIWASCIGGYWDLWDN